MIQSLIPAALVLLVCVSLTRGDANATEVVNAEIEPGLVSIEHFREEIAIVEDAIGRSTRYSRDDSLAMYGRTSASSGEFNLAAAAYAIFLNEFGAKHEYSARVAERLGDCLFPLRYDQNNAIHTTSGSRIESTWRMGYSPRTEHLQQAVHAFELAASLASDQYAKGSALLKVGWVHRVLGEWDASTMAWDRCANEVTGPKSAADALWLAAENLEWSNRPAEAIARLERMAQDYPDDARIPAAIARIENLRAEARRSTAWLSDPVASLVAEIEARNSARSPFEVYKSVVRWLQRRGERSALVAISRWACTQDDWANKDRVACRYDLVDALLTTNEANALTEAAERLREIGDITQDDATVVHATIQGARLQTRLERYDDADQMLSGLADQVKGSNRWEPVVLTELADWLVKRGDKDRAIHVLNSLAASHPHFDVSDRLEALRNADGKEGAQ